MTDIVNRHLQSSGNFASISGDMSGTEYLLRIFDLAAKKSCRPASNSSPVTRVLFDSDRGEFTELSTIL